MNNTTSPGKQRGPVTLRSYQPRDLARTVAMWHETNLASYPYVEEHQRHTLEDATAFFRDRLAPRCEITLAVGAKNFVAGLIALQPGHIDQLCVHIPWQRTGIGTRLLEHARALHPSGLRLFTFQRNATARGFYEKHGFRVVAFGISPAPENEPDVEYRWSPSQV
jgi:ribosomal protein S18 acetylase RimI-like enzyme